MPETISKLTSILLPEQRRHLGVEDHVVVEDQVLGHHGLHAHAVQHAARAVKVRQTLVLFTPAIYEQVSHISADKPSLCHGKRRRCFKFREDII